MSHSLDKPAYSKDISMSSAITGVTKTGDKPDVYISDDQPLLLEGKTENRVNWNIWDAPIISGFLSFKSILGENFCRAIYVLFMLTMCFMLAQQSMWLLGVTAADMQSDQDWGTGDGRGPEYDFLAGPLFAIMSILSTLPVGYVVDKHWISKRTLLAIACFVWSGSTIATGYSQHYWQIVVYRMVTAISTSAAQPLCASIVSDFYPSQIISSAMAIFNFGIYTGFSIAYGAGNWLSQRYSWRYAWWVFGYIGGGLALLLLCLPKYRAPIEQFKEIADATHLADAHAPRVRVRHHKNQNSEADIDYSSAEYMEQQQQLAQQRNASLSYHSDDSERMTPVSVEKVSIGSVIQYYVKTPSLFLLLIASLYRNSGGYIWGYQANNFLITEKGESADQIARWLGWIPAVAGSIGCLFGGALSDRLAAKYGKGANDTQFIQSTVTIRIWVLVVASLISGPLAAGTLLFDVPYCYWSLFGMYLFSEMWIPITVTVVAELSPKYMKSTLLSIYYFVIAFGGFSPQLVSPVQKWVNSYFWSIFILWPGVYCSVAILFFLVIFTYKRDLRKMRSLEA